MKFVLAKHFAIRLNWHARRGGGLLLGARFAFPVSVCENIEELEGTEEEHWKIVTFGLSLIVCTISFEFHYGHHRDPVWQQLEPK